MKTQHAWHRRPTGGKFNVNLVFLFKIIYPMFVFTAKSKITFAIGERFGNLKHSNFWIRKFWRSFWLEKFRKQAKFFSGRRVQFLLVLRMIKTLIRRPGQTRRWTFRGNEGLMTVSFPVLRRIQNEKSSSSLQCSNKMLDPENSFLERMLP